MFSRLASVLKTKTRPRLSLTAMWSLPGPPPFGLGVKPATVTVTGAPVPSALTAVSVPSSGMITYSLPNEWFMAMVERASVRARCVPSGIVSTSASVLRSKAETFAS
jgi:hypothetical protein